MIVVMRANAEQLEVEGVVKRLEDLGLGAHLSARAPGGIVRRALAFVLLASALKLLDVSNRETGMILLAVAVMAPLVWMAVRRRHGFPAIAFGRAAEE